MLLRNAMLVSAASRVSTLVPWVSDYLDIVKERYAGVRGVLGLNLGTLGLSLT